MSNAVPWKSLDEAIAALQKRRDLLSRQIDALQSSSDDRAVLITLQYVVQASMSRVADWANAQEWRLTGADGQPRRYQQHDIRQLLLQPPPSVEPALTSLASDIFGRNVKTTSRQFE